MTLQYMTFRASCSYAGLANLLAFYGVETEDREIALQMDLPYLFAKEDGRFCAGPILQGAEWFNLYLKPLGFSFKEIQLSREEAGPYLGNHAPAMLGLRVSPESKHAVIFTGRQGEQYRFLNNRHPDSAEPDEISLTEAELLSRLDARVTVGTLERCDAAAVDHGPYLGASLEVFRSLRQDIEAFCREEREPAALRQGMNALFRPILLDGVTMLELLGETGSAGQLKRIQSQFLAAVREERPARLDEKLDMAEFRDALDQYENLLIARMKPE